MRFKCCTAVCLVLLICGALDMGLMGVAGADVAHVFPFSLFKVHPWIVRSYQMAVGLAGVGALWRVFLEISRGREGCPFGDSNTCCHCCCKGSGRGCCKNYSRESPHEGCKEDHKQTSE